MSNIENKLPYDESRWLFSAARVRALENNLPDDRRIERMVQARDAAEVCSLCGEFGLRLDPADTEAGLRDYLVGVYAEAAKMSPDPAFIDVLRLSKDAHNIKSALKCSVAGHDPSHLLVECGTVPAADVASAIERKKYDLLPEHMREAAPEALDVWAKTRDPQYIDVLVDNACARDRADLAARSGIDFIVDLVALDCDVANILTCIRIMRMTGDAADTEYLRRMLTPCGKLSHDLFVSLYNDGESALWAALSSTGFARVAESLDSSSQYSLSAVERAFDDLKIDFLKRSRYLLAGAPVVVAYVCAAEYCVKNLRIIIAGKNAGLDADKIRERLRGSYV